MKFRIVKSDLIGQIKEQMGVPDKNKYERLASDMEQLASDAAVFLISPTESPEGSLDQSPDTDDGIEQKIREWEGIADEQHVTPEIEEKLEMLPPEEAQAIERYFRAGIIPESYLDEVIRENTPPPPPDLSNLQLFRHPFRM